MSDFLSPNLVVFAATIAAVFLSFYLATGRVRKQVIASQTKSHSLNQYYGFYVSLWVLVPAILLALIWMFAADPMLTSAAKARMVAAYPNLPDSFLNLKMAQLVNIASGYIKAPDAVMAAQAELLRAAQASADRARSLTLAVDVCWLFLCLPAGVARIARPRAVRGIFTPPVLFIGCCGNSDNDWHRGVTAVRGRSVFPRNFAV